MLEAAREQRADGRRRRRRLRRDRTAAPRPRRCSLGLDVLPPRTVDYRGATLREFDLDAALARQPDADPGRRAGPHQRARAAATPSAGRMSSSCSTPASTSTPRVNVQHLESLNDVVAKITGVVVRETVPDAVFEQADEVELVDLPPDDLLERLQRGQGLRPRAGRAGRSATSSARAISSPCASWPAADGRARRRADARLPRDQAIQRSGPPPSGCWSASARARPRPAGAGGQAHGRAGCAPVDRRLRRDPAHRRLPAEARERLTQTLRLAEQLGAETVTLTGSDDERARSSPTPATATSPRSSSASRAARAGSELLFGSFVDELVQRQRRHRRLRHQRRDARPSSDAVRASGDVDRPTGAAYGRGRGRRGAGHRRWPGSCSPFFELANLVMVYLLGVVAVATPSRAGPVAAGLRPQRGRLRFLLRPAVLHLRGLRHPVPLHLRRSCWSSAS